MVLSFCEGWGDNLAVRDRFGAGIHFTELREDGRDLVIFELLPFDEFPGKMVQEGPLFGKQSYHFLFAFLPT